VKHDDVIEVSVTRLRMIGWGSFRLGVGALLLYC
jgi:hypothetical protein